MELNIPAAVSERLGYYVYLYVDPRNDRPFYVGKGKGKRVLSHLSAEGESRKVQTIRELKALGLSPRLDILAHALPSEETAFRIEAAVIDLLHLDNLANLVSGWNSIQFGRLPLEELIFYYAAEPVEIVDPALLIRINRLYRRGMSPKDLYDATRGRWKLGPRRERARIALAVFNGVVREVYNIDQWHAAGETSKDSAIHTGPGTPGRWEFTGAVSPEAIRSKYHGRSVLRYFPKGLQSPVLYVNC